MLRYRRRNDGIAKKKGETKTIMEVYVHEE